MTAALETVSALERRITLNIARSSMEGEVQTRLRKLAKTVKADGFRPGKVPMNVVAQRYGYSVEYEVMQDKVSDAFISATNEAKMRVAGAPKFDQKTEGVAEGDIAFIATFEVYPDIVVGDLAGVEVEKVSTVVTEAAVDKTLDILRKQRRVFYVRGEAQSKVTAPAGLTAELGDRVTVDFEGKLDGVVFAGGSASEFQFLLGEKQMLPEFETATLGLAAGETKLFDLAFPADYHGKDVAGKTAQFSVKLIKVEWPHLPDVDAAFARTLGVADGNVDALRADIRGNLEREVKFRLVARNKQGALDALAQAVNVDVPKSLTASESERMVEAARADMKERGMKDAATTPIPAEIFAEQATKRVKLGLIVGELVRSQKLQATPEQIKSHIDELAQSYEKPADVVTWYYSKRERLSEVEAVVIENNVTDFILRSAKVVDKQVDFDDVMAA